MESYEKRTLVAHQILLKKLKTGNGIARMHTELGRDLLKKTKAKLARKITLMKKKM